MYAGKEATVERVEAHLAALEREKAGYERRLESLKAGNPDRLGENAAALLAGRIRQVDEQLKAAKSKLHAKSKKDVEGE